MERLLKTSKTRRTFEPFFSSQRNDDVMLLKGAVFCALCFGSEKFSPAFVNIKRNKQPKSELWKTDSLTSSKTPIAIRSIFLRVCSPMPYFLCIFFLPFIPSINALGGYFYVSLYLVAIHTVWSSWIKMCRNAALKHITFTYTIYILLVGLCYHNPSFSLQKSASSFPFARTRFSLYIELGCGCTISGIFNVFLFFTLFFLPH